MTTSGSTDFTVTTNEIIKDAFAKINVVGVDQNPSSEDSSFAYRELNRMVKRWQAQGNHLWKKKTGTIFLQKGQREYDLSATGDHAAIDYVETTLSADEAIGQTTLSITSSTGMTAGDYIGIENDDNELFWSTISSVPDGISVIINAALTTAASSGLKVYAYTTRIGEPFFVYSAVREDESEIDVPVDSLSYEEYFQQPNKTQRGTPTLYEYDRQLGVGIIRVWLVPENVKWLLKITYGEKIEDFDSNSNTPDFPQEWEDALVLNLAIKLAPAYGKANDQNFVALQADAEAALTEALGADNEQESMFLQPDFRGGLI
jgi:hypothetical protein